MRPTQIPPSELGSRQLTGCYPFRDHRTVAQVDADSLCWACGETKAECGYWACPQKRRA